MLEVFQQFEIALIEFIQSLGVWLVPPMQWITQIGSENFFMIIMPALYWSFDAALGFRLAILLLLSNGINGGLKIAFHSSRPYWLSPRIHAYSTESSFGFPSGHAQTAASIWGFLAIHMRSKAMKSFLFLLVFLIGFSRVFLGVHFFTDVLGGWLIGAFLVWGLVRLEKPLGSRMKDWSLRRMLFAALFSSILLGATILLPAAVQQNQEIPQPWIENALSAAPGNELNPFNIQGSFTIAGTWLGFMAGFAWLYHRQGKFNTNGTPFQRIMRYFVGLLGIFFLYYVLGSIFPRGDNLPGYTLRFLRYALVGLWISVLAPLSFQKLGLAVAGERPLKEKPL